MRKLAIVIALLIPQLAAAQWRLEVREVDAFGLPHIRMTVLLTYDGKIYPNSGQALWRFTQNGQPVDFVMDCPDSGWMNSIALVLDNSGSMSGMSMQYLKDASKMLIDSLGISDEAALVPLNPAGACYGFSTAKDSLRSWIDGMNAGGGTSLYDAIILALERMAGRSGKKVVVIFTDGIDNSSRNLPSRIRTLADSIGAKLFTIGYGTGAVQETFLAALANESGAKYFRVFGAAQLAEVFRSIASEITFPGCILRWQAPDCVDSVRFLHLEALVRGNTVVWDSLVRFPNRPDTLELRVEAPPEIAPGGFAIAYIRLLPRIHTGLSVSFSFLFRYDPALLEIAPLIPVTLGTITQNTRISVASRSPGVVQCTAEMIQPAFAEGNLVGFRLTGLAADSSRPVRLSLDSVFFEAGCPNIVVTTPDTIEVCQCRHPLIAWIAAPSVVSTGSDFNCDIFLLDTANSTIPMMLDAFLDYDASLLEVASVSIGDANASRAGLFWDLPHSGRLRIRSSESFPALTQPIALRVRFKSRMVKEPAPIDLTLPRVNAWSRCCTGQHSDTAARLLLDGYCTKVMTRLNTLWLGGSTPHPIKDRGNIRFRIPEDMEGGEAILILYDLRGTAQLVLYRGTISAGEHIAEFDASSLEPGAYITALHAGGQTTARMLLIRR